MKKALIIYGSTTGNTEDMAGMVKAELEQLEFEAEVKDVTQAQVGDLTAEHDLLLLGCPAYGDDEIELQEDFADFYEKLNGLKLDGKPFAVFAPGDSTYEHFCGSVDMLEEKMGELGGKLVTDGLKIDGDPGDASGEIADWTKSITSLLQGAGKINTIDCAGFAFAYKMHPPVHIGKTVPADGTLQTMLKDTQDGAIIFYLRLSIISFFFAKPLLIWSY